MLTLTPTQTLRPMSHYAPFSTFQCILYAVKDETPVCVCACVRAHVCVCEWMSPAEKCWWFLCSHVCIMHCVWWINLHWLMDDSVLCKQSDLRFFLMFLNSAVFFSAGCQLLVERGIKTWWRWVKKDQILAEGWSYWHGLKSQEGETTGKISRGQNIRWRVFDQPVASDFIHFFLLLFSSSHPFSHHQSSWVRSAWRQH